MSWHVVLASASPARRRLLEQSGILPEIRVSGVDENAVSAALPGRDTAALTVALAEAKARAVAADYTGRRVVVIGADSLFSVGGRIRGKPADADEARRRWAEMAGASGDLVTGHCVIRCDDGRSARSAVHTRVDLTTPDPDEIEYYIGTGEPLEVAGALTLDGLGAPFVAGVVGDPGNVIGLSLPGLRNLLRTLEIRWPDVVTG